MKTLRTIGFWILSCTWGILLTLFGAIAAIVAIFLKSEMSIFAGRYITFKFPFYGGWGFEAGPFFYYTKDADILSLKQHEAGHGIQNILYGPFMIILVSIPSMIRFHYRNWLLNHDIEKYLELPEYDAIWFEGQATRWGKYWYPNGELR